MSINKNDVILITGGSGLLGTALQKKFVEESINFLAPKRLELDLLDSGATESYIKRIKPNVVIHLAGMVLGLGGNIRNQMRVASYNTIINNNLFSALFNNPPAKIFFAGSVASYPFPFKLLPLQEEDFFNGLPHCGEFGYAMAKRHAYTYLEILRRDRKVSFTYGVFTNLFGENDSFDIENGHVIPSLIAKAFKAKLDNCYLEVWGSGEAERDFLYSNDAANAIYFLLNNELTNSVLNISSGASHSIRYTAELIAKYACIDKVKFLHSMPSGILHRSVSNKKMTDIGFNLSTKFEEAIHNTYQWYVKNN